MGSSHSVGKRALNSDEPKEKEEKKYAVGSLVLSHLDSASDLCKIARVCKALHVVVNSNDTIWQYLSLSLSSSLSSSYSLPRPHCTAYSTNYNEFLFSASSVLHETSSSPFSPISFAPSSKLPCHTWKQVYQQMVQYKAEIEEEKKRYIESCDMWNKLLEYGCEKVTYDTPHIPLFHLPVTASPFEDNPVSGFPSHPGKSEYRVLPFTVDLIQTAAMYIDLLVKVGQKKELKNEEFLSQAINRYMNFLHLKHKYKNYTLIPTLDIEYVWVSHMLRPSMYINDCTALFGEVIDHNIMITNAYTYINQAIALKETSDLYYKEFGERYCNEDTIKKLKSLPHFSTSGVGAVDAKSIEILLYPTKYIFINCAPSYVGDLGIAGGLKFNNKAIGLRVNDLMMDHRWLEEFKLYMSAAVKDPLDTQQIFECETSNNQPANMKPGDVYRKLWKAYEKFLYLAAKYPPAKGHYVHPSYAIDVIWHAHMIYPKLYAKETKDWVGYLVDHEPWPDSDKKDMQKSCDSINDLWQKEFEIALHKEHITIVHSRDNPFIL